MSVCAGVGILNDSKCAIRPVVFIEKSLFCLGKKRKENKKRER